MPKTVSGRDEAAAMSLIGREEVFEAKTLPFVTEMMLSLSDEQVVRLPERLEKDAVRVLL